MRPLVGSLWILCLAAGPAAPQPGEDSQPRLEVVDSSPVTIGERIVFRSGILETDRATQIWIPESFDVSSPDHTYPVIFINGSHGREFFPTLVGLVRLLGERERIPESIVVSLDNGGAIPEIHTNGMWSRGSIGGSADPRQSLRHLREELIPYLETHYRANDYRIVIGVSGSSLFPIYTLFEAPDLFDSHILIAAADMVGMGLQPGETFVDALEAAWTKTPKREAKLYVGVADDDLNNRDDYRVNFEQLGQRLGRFEGLDLETEILPRTDHYEALIKGVMSALDQNFPKERWSSRYRDLVAQDGDALDNIDRYYTELSKDYGFTVLPRADRWNSVNCLRFMTRHLIREGRAKEAVTIAERRIEYRPRSPESYTGLADALEADERIDAAVKAQQKAIALARSDGDDTARLEERLDVLKEKVNGEPSER